MSGNEPADGFAASRYRYLRPPVGDGRYCVGNVTECYDYTDDGGVRIPWGGTMTPEEAARVRSLHLRPSRAQLRRPRLPAFLPDLGNLAALHLPTPLVPLLTPTGVPAGLPTLVISHDHLSPVPEAPLAADAVLPGLRAVMFVNSSPVPPLAQILDPLPPLEFLSTALGDDEVLRQIRDLTTLRHLELAHLGNVDVFAHITAPLRAMEIGGTGTRFPVARLATLPTLRALRLNGLRAEIDCRVFRELPELVELTILNSKRITHVEALLECRKLSHLSLTNCGNPFRKGIGERFRDGRFDHLDIRYA
ncbi:hypothetical protein [Plantactinospora sp. B24E8]|uniref:hypothetical protein n=1 Tax=Plantactinospora sp. B24E8 TaxID=3153567 RepID=UPI00325F4911